MEIFSLLLLKIQGLYPWQFCLRGLYWFHGNLRVEGSSLDNEQPSHKSNYNADMLIYTHTHTHKYCVQYSTYMILTRISYLI